MARYASEAENGRGMKQKCFPFDGGASDRISCHAFFYALARLRFLLWWRRRDPA